MAEQKIKMKKEELLGIQYLRGIAASLVVVIHIVAMAQFPKYFNLNMFPHLFDESYGGINIGGEGVRLFFVISGFIIPYITLTENKLIPKLITRTFLLRRFIRIVPFLWVCIIAFAATRFIGRNGIFNSMNYLRAMVVFPIGDLEPKQIWTLRHEFLFYGLFSFIVIYCKLNWKVMILWFAAPLIWVSFGLNNLIHNSILSDLTYFVFSSNNILFGVGFIIGILNKKQILNSKIKLNNGFLISLLLMIFIFILLHFIHIFSNQFYNINIFASAFLYGLIVILGIVVITDKPINIFDRLGLLLGDASYSIYLVHGISVSGLLGIWSKYQHNPNPIVLIFTILFISCLFGIVVHLYIEKPLVKHVGKILNKYFFQF